MHEFLEFLQVVYSDYVDGVAIVQVWYAALVWLTFGTLAACVAFWHMGVAIPSLSKRLIKKSSRCSRLALAGSILFLVGLAIPFGIILQAITERQIAYAGASIVVLLAKPSIFLNKLRE